MNGTVGDPGGRASAANPKSQTAYENIGIGNPTKEI
jgi:hypothetical protein